MNRSFIATIFALSFFLWLAPASAHEIKPGYLEISETTQYSYDVVWKSPLIRGRPLPVEPGFPEICERMDNRARSSVAGALVVTATLQCQASLSGQRIEFNGLDATLTDVLVRVRSLDGALQALRATPDAPSVVVAIDASTRSIAGTYFALGVEHILLGIDHLLFVFALVLLIRTVRRLIETITAFTLAHSITLIAASLGWVHLPSRPVEAVIALSIVFLAHEIISRESGTLRTTERWPWMIAFVFGLLHGFGFAGALAEIGLPKNDVPVALLTFNLGVEAGQLVFLTGVLVVLALINRSGLRQRFDSLASYAIGITASVWLFERLI